MKMLRHQSIWVALIALAAAWLGFSEWRLIAATGRRAAAIESLERCRELSARIVIERQNPETAAADSQAEEELSQQVESWAAHAGLGASSVERIDPIAPRRLNDTDYVVEGADIELGEARLDQLARLAASVERDDPRLAISSLRISAPRGEAADRDERWRVELALTYLRHAPKSGR